MKTTNSNDSILFPVKDTKAHLNTVKAYSRGVWVEDSELKESLDHVIEQAEQLEKSKKEFADDIDFKRKEVHRLQAENKRLREELEFYGKRKNYNNDINNCECCRSFEVFNDYGARARKALEGDKTNEST